MEATKTKLKNNQQFKQLSKKQKSKLILRVSSHNLVLIETSKKVKLLAEHNLGLVSKVSKKTTIKEILVIAKAHAAGLWIGSYLQSEGIKE